MTMSIDKFCFGLQYSRLLYGSIGEEDGMGES